MTHLSVCIGSACHLKGAYNVISTFQHLIEEYRLHDQVEFAATFCRKQCHKPGVSVSFEGESYSIAAEDARKFFRVTVLQAIRTQNKEDGESVLH